MNTHVKRLSDIGRQAEERTMSLIHAVPDPEPTPPQRVHVSVPSRVLIPVCALALAGCVFPYEAWAQAVAVMPTPSPEVGMAFGFLELLRSGGSLGVAVIAFLWALRKDKEAQAAQLQIIAVAEARVADAKAMNGELLRMATENAQALSKVLGALEGLKVAVGETRKVG